MLTWKEHEDPFAMVASAAGTARPGVLLFRIGKAMTMPRSRSSGLVAHACRLILIASLLLIVAASVPMPSWGWNMKLLTA